MHTCNLSMQRMKQEKQEFKVHLYSKFKDHMGYMGPDLKNAKTKQSSLFQFSVVRERTGEIQSRKGKQRPRTKKGRIRWKGRETAWLNNRDAAYTASLFRTPIFRKIKSLVSQLFTHFKAAYEAFGYVQRSTLCRRKARGCLDRFEAPLASNHLLSSSSVINHEITYKHGTTTSFKQ